MQLIEIDVVGAEALQAVVTRPAHVLGPRALALLVDRHAELRRDDRLMSTRRQRPSEVLFALGRAVDIGRVEEVDADVERRVDDAFRGRFVDAHPEIVAAQADKGNTKGTYRAELHPHSISLLALSER